MAVSLALALALTATQPPETFAQVAEENRALSAMVQSEGETRATEAFEPAALRGSGGRAYHDRRGLHLKLLTGCEMVLQIEDDCSPSASKREQACVNYSLVADLKSRGAYVVAASDPGDGDYLIIDDRTGQITEVETSRQAATLVKGDAWRFAEEKP